MAFKFILPSEHQIEDAIITFLNYQVGCFAFKVQTKASWDPQLGRYRALPKWVLPGTPDVLCCMSYLPKGMYHKGIPIFIGFEIKDAKGRQSPKQKDFQEALGSKADGFYFVVREIKEVEAAIEAVKKEMWTRVPQSPAPAPSQHPKAARD